MTGLSPHQIAGTDGGLREALLAADLPTDDMHEGGWRLFRFGGDGETTGYGDFKPTALLRRTLEAA